jgi:hypothetical protein
MRSEIEPIIRGVKLLVAERAQLAGRGPHFIILHRFWKPETICTPGEAIAEVRLIHRRRETTVPLSLRLMLLFDYLARHKSLGQSAGQIAAGLSADPFTRQHGAYAGAKARLKKTVSRTSVKQQVMRLRTGLRRALRKAGLNLDPKRILISEMTVVNEVRYRLKAVVQREHQEF